jgi:hypothetical protein
VFWAVQEARRAGTADAENSAAPAASAAR